MDLVAIAQLRVRYAEAVTSAETYRDAAEKDRESRDFYRALAFTYERSAREMKLMLDRVERLQVRPDPPPRQELEALDRCDELSEAVPGWSARPDLGPV
jgi:hypothetical protein